MVTITQQPSMFTPVGNPVRIAFTSDNPNVVFYRMSIILFNVETIVFTTIATIDIYPTPNEPLVGRTDLSAILKDYVGSKLKPSITSNLESQSESSYLVGCNTYEWIYNPTTGVTAQGTSYNTTGFTVIFNGDIDRVAFANWNADNYVINITPSGIARFLTNKQPDRNIHLNYHSKEFLYYYLLPPKSYLSLAIEYYNIGSGTSLNKTIPYGTAIVNSKSGIKRLNASPTTLFTISELNSLSHYNIQLIQSNAAGTLATPLTVKYHYTYHNDVCDKPVYVYWLNKFGCYEVSEFVVADGTFYSEKETTLMNNNSIISGVQQDFISDPNSNIFNEIERTLNVKTNMTYKLTTRSLSDNEMKFLAGIFHAKKIYMEVDDMVNNKVSYIPVQLADNSYSMTSKKLLKENNIKTLTFKMSDGFNFDY